MLSEDGDPYFTSLCSSKTLQSASQGFFMDFAEHVTEIAGADWLADTFGNLKSDKARITACYSDPKVSEVVRGTLENVRELYRQKSATISRQRRLEGDCAWIAGDPQRALAFYNQSVMRAPTRGADVSVDEGLSLAEALACRSEALQALGKPEQSICDIQLAVTQGFPETERHRLYERMAECYKELGQTSEAKLSYQLATKILTQNKDGRHTEKIKAIQTEMKNMRCDSPKQEESKQKTEKKVLPEVTAGSKPELPNASSRIRISRTKTAGRFAVAADPIEVGDTLVAEPPYASCLLPEFFGSHCHHCFVRLEAPVGCPNCSGLAFCSLQCRDAAIDSYHSYECKIMDMLIGSGMSILCHLALRMLTQSGLKHFLELRSVISQGVGANAVHGTNYPSIYNLVTHADRRPPQEFLHRTLMALFLLKCLQRTKFFPNPTPDSKDTLNKDETYIGSLLLRNLQLLQFNAHEIFETRVAEVNQFKGSKVAYIGVGIYPTVALFNHDCYPAVHRYFVGRNIVIKATRPLVTGEVVAENYGPVFTKRLLAARQRALTSRYWFKCVCQSCKEDWPPFEDMAKNNMLKIRCPTQNCTHFFSRSPDSNLKKTSVSIKCPKCKKHIALGEHLTTFQSNEINFEQGRELMESGNTTQAAAKFCQYLETFHKVARPPLKDVQVCEGLLGGCFSLDGTVWLVPNTSKPMKDNATLNMKKDAMN